MYLDALLCIQSKCIGCFCNIYNIYNKNALLHQSCNPELFKLFCYTSNFEELFPFKSPNKWIININPSLNEYLRLFAFLCLDAVW